MTGHGRGRGPPGGRWGRARPPPQSWHMPAGQASQGSAGETPLAVTVRPQRPGRRAHTCNVAFLLEEARRRPSGQPAPSGRVRRLVTSMPFCPPVQAFRGVPERDSTPKGFSRGAERTACGVGPLAGPGPAASQHRGGFPLAGRSQKTSWSCELRTEAR